MVIDIDTRIPHTILQYWQVCRRNMLNMTRSRIKTMNMEVVFE